jgi:flagellar biosynthesis GTPase FlhF
MTTETRTYRGATLEELLPTIRTELGDDAIIIRQREGLVGGVAGFFAKRCVEVEAQRAAAQRVTPAMPAQNVFDAYDDAAATPTVAAFEDELDRAEAEFQPMVETFAALPAEPAAGEEPVADTAEPEAVAPAAGEPDPVFDAIADRLVAAGLPRASAQAIARDAERSMAPFDQLATPESLVRRALARAMKIEHGWKTKRRTIALIGASGSGKTLAAAKLCHAYTVGSRLEVRTLSLEPSSGAYRLGQLTEHLDIGVRIAETPDAAARAATRLAGESLTVVDTPPVSPADPESIAALATLLAEVKPDETHLVIPATMSAEAARALYAAVSPHVSVSRILVSKIDESPSPGAAVGLSFELKKPLSYVSEGRRPAAGLRPADGAELAAMVLRSDDGGDGR